MWDLEPVAPAHPAAAAGKAEGEEDAAGEEPEDDRAGGAAAGVVGAFRGGFSGRFRGRGRRGDGGGGPFPGLPTGSSAPGFRPLTALAGLRWAAWGGTARSAWFDAEIFEDFRRNFPRGWQRAPGRDAAGFV